MSEPLVSVVIPAYNSGKYIKKCISSVLSQTYNNWEIIIILAPSSDNTVREISQFQDGRISIWHEDRKTNCGIARNQGISLAKGEFIAFMDADDWWEPEKLNIVISHFKVNPDKMWGAHGVFFHGKNGKIISNFIHPYKYGSLVNLSAIVFRKELLQKYFDKDGYIFNPKILILEDGDFMFRIRKEPNFFILKEYSHYQPNDDGLTANIPSLKQGCVMLQLVLKYRVYDLILPNLKNIIVILIKVIFGYDIVAIRKKVMP